MNDILNRIPEEAGWTIFLVIAFMVWGAPKVLSKEGAENLYVIGRIARWIGTRQERSIERERVVKGSRMADLQAELEAARQANKETEARLSKQIEDSNKKSDKRFRRQERQLERQMAWIEYSTGWARQVILLAAEHGWHPPLPEWVSFSSWQDRHELPEDFDDAT